MGDTDTSAPVAFCAPGGRFAAALSLVFTGREVTEIRESRLLKGDMVVVVSEPELPLWTDPDAFVVVFPEPVWPLTQVRCPGCFVMMAGYDFSDSSCHYSFCWVTHPPFPPLITGLPHV